MRALPWPSLALAATAALLTYLALTTGLRLACRRLQHSLRDADGSDGREPRRLADGLSRVLARTNKGLLAVVALLVGVGMLPLSEPWHDRVSQLWFAVLALQLGLWGQQAVSLMLRSHHARHAPGSPLSVSSTMLGWALRVALWVVILLAVLSNLGVNVTAFVASLGIGGIAIALAVQNILGDLFASLSIAVDKPFEVGDVISVNGVTGAVEKVGLKTTRIRSVGGEQVVMSNSDLLRQKVSNFKRLQVRRVVFGFGITYDATPDQVAEVPELVRRLIEGRPKLEFLRAHFKGFGESSLDFEVVYRVKDASYDVYMDEQQALNLALMRALLEQGIDFAFPTRTINLVHSDAPADPRPPQQPAAATALRPIGRPAAA